MKEFLTEPEFCVGMFLRPYAFLESEKRSYGSRTITKTFGRGYFTLSSMKNESLHTDFERYLLVNVDRDYTGAYTKLKLLNQEGILFFTLAEKNQSHDKMIYLHERAMFKATDSMNVSETDLNESISVTIENPDYVAEYASKNAEVEWRVRPNTRYHLEEIYHGYDGQVVKSKKW